jgi:hypothetical protein
MAAKTKHAPIVQAIIDGDHDANLDTIVQAAEWRKKKIAAESGIRKGAKVKVADDKRRAAHYAGREGYVVKVNKIRTTVAFACAGCGRHEDTPGTVTETRLTPAGAAQILADECHTCWGVADTAGIPTDLLTAVRA